jgi:hypothetical protein
MRKNSKKRPEENVPAFELNERTVDQLIQQQAALEHFAPGPPEHALQTPVGALPHTPVYTMHRYFARRPWNVFRSILQHYSRPGDVVLDPFVGGGVTAVEGLSLRRRVIGVDLSPLATYITKNEILPVDIARFQMAVEVVVDRISEDVGGLYLVPCPACGESVEAEWFQWGKVAKCPLCRKRVIAGLHEKVGPRAYRCPGCKVEVRFAELEPKDEIPFAYWVRCPKCGASEGGKVTAQQKGKLTKLSMRLWEQIREEGLEIPKYRIPDGDRARDDAHANKGIGSFYQLFTPRNLIALGRLQKAISELPEEFADMRPWLMFTFSATLGWVSVMTSDTTHGWQHHAYWIPDSHYEMNVAKMFKKRATHGAHTVLDGKSYSFENINDFCILGSAKDVCAGRATAALLTQSSERLPLASASVDVVITDPPFGGNVQYAELSDFWTVWLEDELGKGVIDNSREAIETRNQGFETAKTRSHYEDVLYNIFRECHRVLKPGGWLVMTFHNRDIGVWMALHRAANRAGFQLPLATEDRNRGMLYQPAVEDYTRTLHLRASGSMLGDFILSFKRRENPILVDGILDTLNEEEEGLLRERSQHLIEYQGGADLNTLMTGLLPFLQERGLLHRLAQFDFPAFFSKHFVKQKQKWYTRDMVDETSKQVRLADLIPAEILVEKIILSLLRGGKVVSLDNVLIAVYEQLVNSQRPNVETINNVLTRICDRVNLPGDSGRKGFALRSRPKERGGLKPKSRDIQLSLYGEGRVVGPIEHNEIIRLIAKHALAIGYEVHVGETEQGKSSDLQGISTPMLSNVAFGIPDSAFGTIKEIDLLVLKGQNIMAAFEVATTIETANKAINDRYRNLFAALNPAFRIRCHIIVKDEHYSKAEQILYTVANANDGLSDRVRIVKASALTTGNINQMIKP